MLSTLRKSSFTSITPSLVYPRQLTHSAASAPLAKFHILVVADESMDALLQGELEGNGFRITELDFQATPDHIRQSKPDVVVLAADNAYNASQWCRAFRLHQMTLPVHVILPMYTSFDEALLLELGADCVGDHAIEPRLLASRLRALLRRMHLPVSSEPAQSLQFGRLTIDAAARRVTLGDMDIEMSSAEFDLLWLLASSAGEVLKRDAVQIALRGFASDDSHRFIDARLYRLRKRLGNSPEVAARIRTVRPLGYLFAKVNW